jgi:hypothetical protein
MLKDMKSDTHLKPGQKGTKRLLEQYGDKLLCVRYRYDVKRHVRIKTAEIIVSESPCTPSLGYRDHDIINVIVPYAKTALRDRLKAAGGRWNPDEKLWQVSFGAIRGDTELTERIVSE